jgi:hypothetical protein
MTQEQHPSHGGGKEPDRILHPGTPDLDRCDNKVVSARYSFYTFFFVVSTGTAVAAIGYVNYCPQPYK